MNRIDELHKFGQSLWYDNIQRSLLDNGQLKGMIDRGEIKGITSNPSIFNNAIAKTHDYDAVLKPLSWSGLGSEEIFWELAVKDIQDAADLFTSLYESTNHKDGYVSLEVNPFLARDTLGTIREARRLWNKVNRPNLMIKIPATVEGLPAIRQAISEGINVNVTLIFSLKRYAAVMDAFITGLEDRMAKGISLNSIASVASFFVSRVDSKVDTYLDEIIKGYKINSDESLNRVQQCYGQAAVANARLAYELFLSVFSSDRFKKLQDLGAQIQRPLWASTSTKNPNYRDVIYIEELIGNDTVNTVPPATLTAFADHGNSSITIDKNLAVSKQKLQELEEIGISMDKVTVELEEEGVKAFADAFSALMQSVEQRRQEQISSLGELPVAVNQRLKKLEVDNFVTRLFQHDPSLWTMDEKGQAEIKIRMDWLTAPWDSEGLLPTLNTLLAEARLEGFTHALLLGMGGSSLGPEVLRLVNGATDFMGNSGLDLSVLDSTNPDEVLLAKERSPLGKTLYIVASKSGTTGEINAFFQFFWELASKEFGYEAGKHFLAITDPDTKLDKLARERKFWKVINANPKVGGRNSALTAFGLVPAALLGINVKELLSKAQSTAISCRPENSIYANPGIVLGAVLAEAATIGQNKLTVVTDSEWVSFGNWLEQLVAESSGKDGKGIIPVATEPQLSVSEYGEDRLFVYLGRNGATNQFCNDLRQSGKPLLVLDVDSSLDLGSQFYLWEIATATACSILGVNSFDQPDVQDAKSRTLNGVAAYQRTGKLDFGQVIKIYPQGEIYSNQDLEWSSSNSILEAINLFVGKLVKKGDYVGINAFLPRTSATEKDLLQLRMQISKSHGNSVTLGFGPRFLHSTGQLHKGGPDSGIFIEITADPEMDFEIPNEGLTFGTLSMAQALGDYEALVARGRKVLRIHLHKPSISEIFKVEND